MVSILNSTAVIKWLIILSILFQSVNAFASVTTSTHQVDIEHLQAQHEHQSDFMILDDNTESNHDIKDCHHCGHCSGSHLSYILDGNAFSASKLFIDNNIPYQQAQITEFIDAILRPPTS